MKKRHEIIATHDISRKTNDIVNAIDSTITYMLKNVNPNDGTPIYTDIATLKSDLADVGISLKDIKAAISTFVTKRNITFDISQYIDSNLIALNTKLTDADTLITKMVTDISKVSVNTLDKIKTYAQTLSNPIANVSAVNYEREIRKTNALNDLLDASSYVLHGISPEDGTPLGFTDEQKKQRVRMYLNQFPQTMTYIFSADLIADAQEMKVYADYVLAHLEDTPLDTLGTYIDDNVPKLPLIRRNWA